MAEGLPNQEESGLSPERQAMLVAATDMIGRTGAEQSQIRYCDEEDPTVWLVGAQYKVKAVGNYTRKHWEFAAGMDPVTAAVRLLDTLVDGGFCVHCERPTGVSTDIDQMPLEDRVCWYQYDPELKTFRRGCEGG